MRASFSERIAQPTKGNSFRSVAPFKDGEGERSYHFWCEREFAFFCRLRKYCGPHAWRPGAEKGKGMAATVESLFKELDGFIHEEEYGKVIKHCEKSMFASSLSHPYTPD
jgi:hypothetical protein